MSSARLSHQLEHYRIGMFEAHGAWVLKHLLDPWVVRLNEGLARGWSPQPPEELCGGVIVDDRPTQQLRACVVNTLLMGKLQMGITLYTSPRALQRCRELLADVSPWVRVKGLGIANQENYSWLTYNLILKAPAFWEQLETAKVLVFQADTLMIEPPDLRAFCFGYVGSPWSRGKTVSEAFPRYSQDLESTGSIWETRALCRTVPQGVSNGNGGLSIRDRALMAHICREESSEAAEPEDIFFARHLAQYDSNPAPAEIVERFSCETHYQRSSGAHACWRYLAAEEQAEIYERHLKQVMALTAVVGPS